MNPVSAICRLYDLKNIPLEIQRLFGGEAGWVVPGLNERFKQSCVSACVLRGLTKHFEKQFRRHELAA